MKKYIFFVSIPVLVLGVWSCSKTASVDQSASPDATLAKSVTAAVSSVVATNVNQTSSEDLQSVLASKFDTLTGGKHGRTPGMGGSRIFDIPYISSCATVTVSGTTYPKTVTIDYGTGCTNSRGQFKQGEIIIEVSDTLSNAGAFKTITYKDFYVDSTRIDLTATQKNLGKNAAGHWIIAATYEQKITKVDGTVIVEKNADTTEWVGGFETATNSDDAFYKSGSGSITVNDTISYSKQITKPLFYDSGCRYIVSGTVVLFRNSITATIDYGDGTCDDVASVTTNGVTEEININTLHFNDNGLFHKFCTKTPGHKGKG